MAVVIVSIVIALGNATPFSNNCNVTSPAVGADTIALIVIW